MALWLWPLLMFLMAEDTGAQDLGFQACKTAGDLKVLEVLPGGGWDNLRNVEMGEVMSLDYSLCRTTEDGEYLIPNDVFVVPHKKSTVEVHSELIENWMVYTDAFAQSINAEASFLSVLNGKFSESSQKTKMHNVYDETITTRVQARYHIYSVKAHPSFTFQKDFRHQLVGIGNQLENNQSRIADYLAEMLVLNYGTHVLTSLEAGASLIQEDQVKRSFVMDKETEKGGITASASATFFSKINVGIGGSIQIQDELTKSYVENTVDSKIESLGSVPFYPGITLQKWQEGIPNQLVAIGKAGFPLPFFITPEALPELPGPTVKQVATTVENAIRLYYAVNTHPGCVKPDSSNFNFQANVDDGSCQNPNTNFSFGGVFQECHGISGKNTEELCQTYRIQNPLTGSYSCPANFSAVLLHGEERTTSKPQTECHEECDSCWLFFSCCKSVCGTRYYASTVQFNAYWCAATGTVPQGSGVLFGGLYSTGQENPISRTYACPSYFFPLVLFDNLKVCVSSDYEMGSRFAVPFGGFFSCQAGNPLAGLLKGQSPGILQDFFYQGSPSKYPMKCPVGYSQHKAYLSDGCQILYCLQAGALFGQQLAPVRLPPFLRVPSSNASLPETILVSSDGSQAWVKIHQSGIWRLANDTDEKEMARLFQGQLSLGPTGGTIAGISVAVIAVLATAVAIAVYRVWRYKNRRYQEMQNPHIVEDQGSYGATASSPQLSAA
ncbi:macrophage-expressed gene 1 protein-like [Eublepharis macularius]|uniref:Macrophage-expressed gene 1 protein-like n=1 Tax=Eublepharis macularius TaxID=481883 RepID=A0AA97IZ71_EUBMA|nr:macrophage-expressed gene 1 protein-like [Eublepharis macularius]